MNPRVENVEVLSSRLKVPMKELQGMPDSGVGRNLGVTLEKDGPELVLSSRAPECALRFRPIGTEAMLCAVSVVGDDAGAFLEGVLLPLVARFQGDLHIRVVWNDSERNTHGNWSEVKIVRGEFEDENTYAPAAATSGPAGEQVERSEADVDEGPTPEQREIQELLAKGRAYWNEYQRLKAGK